MSKQSYHILGVMSGTSLDGIDLAELFFTFKNGHWHFEIGTTETQPYPDHWVKRLKEAIGFSADELQQINRDYTQYLGAVIADFIDQNSIQNIDAVCSHGHTILHQPQNGITLQIGNLPEIAKLVKQTVVCDFRVQDVALGGQGAPLVPIGDRLLFADFTYCLNLGGFSNVSFEHLGQRLAFDISPVNTVLNHYANLLDLPYDAGGKIAASGKVHTELLNTLNGLAYYQKSFPKSLGVEFVKEWILPLMANYPLTTEDSLCTFVEHIAYQTAQALPQTEGKILVTGGGAYNHFLLDRMRSYLPKIEFIIPDAKTLEFKEALIFGLLGVLRLRNEINVLSSVTGAKHDHSSGKVYKSTS
jgi:anhydro-N-acetylmuramic acid kinase